MICFGGMLCTAALHVSFCARRSDKRTSIVEHTVFAYWISGGTMYFVPLLLGATTKQIPHGECDEIYANDTRMGNDLDIIYV